MEHDISQDKKCSEHKAIQKYDLELETKYLEHLQMMYLLIMYKYILYISEKHCLPVCNYVYIFTLHCR